MYTLYLMINIKYIIIEKIKNIIIRASNMIINNRFLNHYYKNNNIYTRYLLTYVLNQLY